jgi:hypothetical protein
MDTPDFAEARRLMQLEYETGHQSTANFDDQRARIKGWAITVAGALLALAVNAGNWWLGVIATAAVILFAYIDALVMAGQQNVLGRLNELERYMEAARRGNIEEADAYVFGFNVVYRHKPSSRQVLRLMVIRTPAVLFFSGLALTTGVASVLLLAE